MEKYTRLESEPSIEPYEGGTASQSSEENLLQKSSGFIYKTPPFYKRHATSIAVHFLLVLLNLSICFAFLSWTIDHYSHGPRVRYTPARDAIEYGARTFDVAPTYLEDGKLNPDKVNLYNGKPTPELENAWNELLQYQNIRLSKDEIGERKNEDGLIELSDGGYFATLTVYHSLHCLKRLHRWMNLEYYYGNLTEPELFRLRGHTEHCLDVLRQNVQCQADITVIPLNWGTKQPLPLGSDIGHHECANWDKLDNWMKDRSINPMKPGYLVHPKLGPAFPEGRGDLVGIIIDHKLSDE
ncbi:hypothetical protein MMC19_006291 [Ptychographa xylographoides]|nr:hypothetical protein [Ptychographa xylographoides]